jgi:hypothetical protein
VKITGMIDISLQYALCQFDELTINNIITSELSLEEKIEVIMKLEDEQKKIILIRIGFNKEFLKTI